VDTHKQGSQPVVGDVVEYALPPHLLLDDGRCVCVCRCGGRHVRLIDCFLYLVDGVDRWEWRDNRSIRLNDCKGRVINTTMGVFKQ
jgi:hypothetical protein